MTRRCTLKTTKCRRRTLAEAAIRRASGRWIIRLLDPLWRLAGRLAGRQRISRTIPGRILPLLPCPNVLPLMFATLLQPIQYLMQNQWQVVARDSRAIIRLPPQCPNAHHQFLLAPLLPLQFVLQGPGLEILWIWQGLHLPPRWRVRVYQRVLLLPRQWGLLFSRCCTALEPHSRTRCSRRSPTSRQGPRYATFRRASSRDSMTCSRSRVSTKMLNRRHLAYHFLEILRVLQGFILFLAQFVKSLAAKGALRRLPRLKVSFRTRRRNWRNCR